MKFIKGALLGVIFIAIFWFFYRFDLPSGLGYALLLLQPAVIYFAIKWHVWKQSTIVLVIYTVIAGFLMDVPALTILHETIRNQYFHVPLWFAMILITLGSVVCSILYLATNKLKYDLIANELVNSGILSGVLGITTGMIWAQYTWGKYWSGDPKQTYAAIGLLVYFAFTVLRGSFKDDIQRARISAIYNVFAFPALVVLLYILPRMAEVSLHPGATGNPAFSKFDLDNDMRLVFYPAIFAWTCLGVWLANIRIRINNIQQHLYDLD